MTEQQRIVIAERQRSYSAGEMTTTTIWHLPAGKLDEGGWYQPIKCGMGITLPGRAEKVPRSQVCPACLSGRSWDTPEQ